MKYNTHTLPNGLRIIHLPSTSRVIYCGYGICAGARDEMPGDEGLAHFCEHTTFKGTQRRKSIQILNCLESVGGDLNAFTNKEDTVYYSAILKENLPRAIDLLTDIVFNSVYPQNELDKEIEVICDEIECYNDSPAELIFDEFENIIFRGHPLGHNILGCADRLRQYTTADAMRFTNCHYRPDNAIFFAYGDVDFDKMVKLIAKSCSIEKPEPGFINHDDKEIIGFNGNNNSESSNSESSNSDRLIIRSRGTHQAHVMIGSAAYSVHNDKRMPLYLLNNILGGPGMNARLNISLREKHGLVYTVESSMVSYSDTGLWCTYFGCDPHDVKKCLKLVKNELDRMTQKPLTEALLNRAKKQIKGQIGVACDNRESFALDFAKNFLHYGWEKDITNLYKRIDTITPTQIQDVAQEIFNPDALTTLIFS